MDKKEFGLLLAAMAIVALLAGGVIMFSSSTQETEVAQVPTVNQLPSPAAAEETTPDPALCGNGVLDAGEVCDPLDPQTAFDMETGKECQIDCTLPEYLDPIECMDARHMEFCVDAEDNPVENYYDCVDEQHYYCEGLSYN